MDVVTVTVPRAEPAIAVETMPHRIGRHVVIDVLGRGGMGVVYSAFDPDLGRRLALKLIVPSGDTELARARMLREAQALARLSHPHVIQIYDVGTHLDRVYVAMELVEGDTLRSWMKQERSWPEVRAMFVKAGQGLAAAHAAGLVHRDFKPDNVLVGSDGRVRVADFGLARPSGLAGAPARPTGEVVDEWSGATPESSERMTQSNARLGTPAYMAAEQWQGGMVDARTDQFAFCVSLYEALVGRRPFTARTREALEQAILSEGVPPLPSSVPTWLRRVVDRGLQVDPDARYPSMEALLEELSFEPGHRRRRIAAVGVIGVVAALAAWGGAWAEQRPGPCEVDEASERMPWTQQRRAAIGAAVRTTDLSYAEQTWQRVSQRLDDYAESWRAARYDACAATSIRREQSDAMLDLRMACLERRREALTAMLEVADSTDADLVPRLPMMVDGLPTIAACEDGPTLRLRAEGVVEPERQDELTAHRAALARVGALHGAARYTEAEALADTLADTLAAEEWEPLWAELTRIRARIELYQGDMEAAERMANDAYLAAVRSRHDVEAARAAILLVSILNDREGRMDEAEAQWRRADAEWARAGRDPQEGVHLLNARAGMEFRRGRHARAQRYAEQAVEHLRASELPEGPLLADLLGNLGSIVGQRGDLEGAESYVRDALSLRERTQGEQHPDTAREVYNLGVALAMQGRSAEARALFERAYELQRAALGDRHPDLTLSLLALGNVSREQGRLDQAERYYQQTLELSRELHGPTHLEVHYPLLSLGELLLERGEPEAAEPRLRESIEILEQAFGQEHPELALPLLRRGEALASSGRAREASMVLERSDRISSDPAGGLALERRYWLARVRGELGETERAQQEMQALDEALEPELPPDVRPDLRSLVAAWIESRQR